MEKTIPVDRLYVVLNKIIGPENNLNTLNIVTIIVTLMQIVDKFKDVKGPQKKVVIITVLDKYVRESMDATKEETKSIRLIIDKTIPTLIDTLISVDKKTLSIKRRNYIRYLCCCLRCFI